VEQLRFPSEGRLTVNTMILKLCIRIQNLTSREEGQDLVEYAMVVALVAFGTTAGMQSLAAGLNSIFQRISTNLGSLIG
jgi:pilus assembly protein Flp/PilA